MVPCFAQTRIPNIGTYSGLTAVEDVFDPDVWISEGFIDAREVEGNPKTWGPHIKSSICRRLKQMHPLFTEVWLLQNATALYTNTQKKLIMLKKPQLIL